MRHDCTILGTVCADLKSQSFGRVRRLTDGIAVRDVTQLIMTSHCNITPQV